MNGFDIDPGDPAHRVASRVSRHAMQRWASREAGSPSDMQKRLLCEMRRAVLGGLRPTLAIQRLDQHEGEAADYWVTNDWVFVVVGDPDSEGSVVATIYPFSKKYQPHRRPKAKRSARRRRR